MLDIPQAIEQAGGNPDLAKDLFTMLLNELPGQKEKLNQALARGDNQAIRDHTHKLYGSTAYCGVPALRKAARELEEAIRAQTDDVSNKIQEVNKAIDDLLIDGQTILDQDWH
jgi:two-component system sensor histidine kinase BarA